MAAPRKSRGKSKGTFVALTVFGLLLFCVLAGADPRVRAWLLSPSTSAAGGHSAEGESADSLEVEKQCHLPQGPGQGDNAHVSGAGATTVAKKEQGEASNVNDARLADGTHVKTILFKNFLIDRLYPSMTGPARVHAVLLGESDHVWVTSYRAEVLDGKSGEASQEYMCHTSVDLVGMPNTEAAHYHHQELTISQGQKEIDFPKGFGLRLFVDPLVEIHTLVMVLNNNEPKLNRSFDFRATLRYCDDYHAGQKNLQPLYTSGAGIFPPVEPGGDGKEEVVKTATAMEVLTDAQGRKRTGHWMVTPGKHVTTQDVTAAINLQYDTTLHYMWMHVHPYAEYMELVDKTTGKKLWRGYATNDPNPKVARLLKTDAFSSVEGIPVYKSHRYEMTVAYNNCTDHDIDAMASLWMYFKSNRLEGVADNSH